jgi:beta-1,4-mannosyl-glycoprotein beta-1,4-N-acetylglucosaminyltransferase
MLIDAFPFCNELDVLDIRLNTLDAYVDYFILVESEKTQTLKDKPLYFDKNKERYAQFLKKIVHVKVLGNECSGLDPTTWQMEHFQRNCIQKGINTIQTKLNLTAHGEHYVMISDADEIPNLEILYKATSRWDLTKPISFDMTYHTFYLNLLTKNKRWIGTVLAPLNTIVNATPQGVRNSKDNIAQQIKGGWHLGYMGGKEMVYKKFFNCVEPMDKSLIPPFEVFSKEFDRKIKNTGSFLFSDKKDDSITLEEHPVEYPTLPQYVIENKEKLNHLIFK